MGDQRTPALRAYQSIDKDQVRMMVADCGYQETAQRTGIAYATLRKWAERHKWNQPANRHAQAVTTVTMPIAQAHAEALQDHEAETRMSLARSARRMAKDCEELPTRHAKIAHTVAQTASIVHKWGNQDQQDRGFTLNVLNLGSLGLSIGDETQAVQDE